MTEEVGGGGMCPPGIPLRKDGPVEEGLMLGARLAVIGLNTETFDVFITEP